MRIISRRSLRAFWERAGHGDSEQRLRSWFAEARKARWRKSQDIKAQYGSASIVGEDRVVFNIGGNKYRLVVAVRYDIGIVFIRFVGTHEEYDAIDVTEV